ncbi:MAG: DUF1007 family protein [Cocleimonas sp.]|nr:DUF1007 family protein [Cocleimonas sp.]
MMRKMIGLLILASLLLSPLSNAHFHYKISSTATLQGNEKKQLTAINMSWLYDATVSSLMLKSGQSMDALVKSIADDLVELNNFTLLTLNGKRIVTKRVAKYHIETVKHGAKEQIKFSFILPLQSPLFIQGSNLGIVHTDSGASASIFYHSANNILLGKTFKPLCQATVTPIQGVEAGEAPENVHIRCRK